MQFYLFNIRPKLHHQQCWYCLSTEETCTRYFRYAVWEM